MIIGGYQDDLDSAATWYFDMESLDFIVGPKMQNERANHGCATLNLGTKSYAIVAGGYSRDWLDSTEILDLQQNNPNWSDGK